MTILTDDERRAEVLRLASCGVPLGLIHRLCAVTETKTLGKFRRAYKAELERGSALADAAVMEALHELAKSGKSVQASLAWAKERLGWSDIERGADDKEKSASLASRASADEAFEILRSLLDEIARSKAGSATGAGPLDGNSSPQPVAAAG